MESNIEKQNGEWKVTFSHGVQTFTLDFRGTREDCQWYKNRLDECFKSAMDDNLKKTIDVLDSDIATVEALHDLLLDEKVCTLDSDLLKKSRMLINKMYGALYGKS